MTTGKNILLVSFDNCMPFQKQSAAFGVRLQTPNLDRIMARAAVFRAAHCEIPLCGPSRASFMTGRMPHDIGLLSNEGDVFNLINAQGIWTCRLKEARYFCSSGGGVCHGRKPLKWRHSTHDIDGEDVALPDPGGDDATGRTPQGSIHLGAGGQHDDLPYPGPLC